MRVSLIARESHCQEPSWLENFRFRAGKAIKWGLKTPSLIRRKCLDHVVVLNETHLHHVLWSYLEYYNGIRTTSLWVFFSSGCSFGSPAPIESLRSCRDLGRVHANRFSSKFTPSRHP